MHKADTNRDGLINYAEVRAKKRKKNIQASMGTRERETESERDGEKGDCQADTNRDGLVNYAEVRAKEEREGGRMREKIKIEREREDT